MNNKIIIISNIIALIGSVLMVLSGLIKSKNKIIIVQTIQIFLLVISNFLLNGITGAIINLIAIVRNIFGYLDKLKIPIKIVLSIIMIVLSIVFNSNGIIGYFPLISGVAFIWLMDLKNIVHFKLLIIFTMLMWFVYDVYIMSYTTSVFDILTIITNIVSIIALKKNKKRKNNSKL